MGVTGETSNDMFTIQEPGLPIASKRWVTGVLLQATKNKTYTPKNTCSGVRKDRSHKEYLA